MRNHYRETHSLTLLLPAALCLSPVLDRADRRVGELHMTVAVDAVPSDFSLGVDRTDRSDLFSSLSLSLYFFFLSFRYALAHCHCVTYKL